MKFHILAVGAVLVLLALFALLNWPAFTALTPLSLGFAEVSAPLGLIMLIAVGVVSGLFLFVIRFRQADVIVESRRAAKEAKTELLHVEVNGVVVVLNDEGEKAEVLGHLCSVASQPTFVL